MDFAVFGDHERPIGCFRRDALCCFRAQLDQDASFTGTANLRTPHAMVQLDLHGVVAFTPLVASIRNKAPVRLAV